MFGLCPRMADKIKIISVTQRQHSVQMSLFRKHIDNICPHNKDSIPSQCLCIANKLQQNVFITQTK